MMRDVTFIDTTFRDGQQSLWAEGMTTGMMLPVASQMDRAGFTSMELIASSHFLKCVRELREDPWERIRLLSKRITRTPLVLMTHYSIGAFDLTPFSILKIYFERLKANGIRRVQLMDPANDLSFRVHHCVKFAKEVGLEVALGLVFSISPKHTDEHYARKVRDAAALKVDTIYLKDSGGLLTPERVRTLIPLFLQNSDGIPVALHSHCTTGLAPLVYLDAVKLGVSTLCTAIPPLANGPSQPSVFNIVSNLKYLGYTPRIDEEAVKPVADHFARIARREGLPIGKPLEYDAYQYVHQVPGGVISNLKHQLSKLRMEERLEEVLAEAVQVRKDLGYPIMVTPFSQYVVSQASINVMLGERYKQVLDEIIQYTLGHWGKESSDAVDPDIRDRILHFSRARELSVTEPPQPAIEEVRQQLGGTGVSDEELLLRYIVREESEIEAMRAAGPIKEYQDKVRPLIFLLQELLKQNALDDISIQREGLSVSLKREKGQPT
jgi:oxaloacetate decarboxylase (Na+ extruding) subunit alpha